jgi:hypothetical protein
MFVEGTLQWTLLERTKIGWAVADAGSAVGPFNDCVKATRSRWKGTRPYVGLDWRKADLTLTTLGEPRKEIVDTIRMARGDTTRVIEYLIDGKNRFIFDAARADIAGILTDWRKLGIEPKGLEPMEAAWLRAAATLADHDAILDMRASPPILLTMTDDMVFNELIRWDGPADEGAVVQAIRRARSEGSPMRSALVLGTLPERVRQDESAATTFEELSILNQRTPPWADAFALASFAEAEEAAKIERAKKKKSSRIVAKSEEKDKAA